MQVITTKGGKKNKIENRIDGKIQFHQVRRLVNHQYGTKGNKKAAEKKKMKECAHGT
jgi:hypothetical protein